jgi:flavin reductase (DIM6/NTAB) family NADH-FMN oxidoreductase RutF
MDMKKMINVFDYAGEFAKHMGRGILLTTKGKTGVNTMTIGWGTIGIEWGKPIFVAYVRGSRYTHQLLEENPEFTINCPVGEFDSKILGFCGTKSGRDIDKIQELGLHPEEPVSVTVPGIKELPLTLECKVLYRNPQPTDTIPQEILDRYYPEKDGVRDFHYAYYAEIVNAYIIEE